MADDTQISTPPIQVCAVCDEFASYRFGPPGAPVQPTDAWFCGEHRQEGERRWAARYGRR
jgi:hypothetical protein